MSDPIDGAAPEVQYEFDRVWKMLDANTQALHGIETQLARLARFVGLQSTVHAGTTGTAPESSRVAGCPAAIGRIRGDYFPDPVTQHAPSPDYGIEVEQCGCEEVEMLRKLVKEARVYVRPDDWVSDWHKRAEKALKP